MSPADPKVVFGFFFSPINVTLSLLCVMVNACWVKVSYVLKKPET